MRYAGAYVERVAALAEGAVRANRDDLWPEEEPNPNPFEWDIEPKQSSSGYSQFTANRQFGDWAEQVFHETIQTQSSEYQSVPYGADEQIHADDDGFEEAFQSHRTEVGEIGRRGDYLLFGAESSVPQGLSRPKDGQEMIDAAAQALTAVEVRASKQNHSINAEHLQRYRDRLTSARACFEHVEATIDRNRTAATSGELDSWDKYSRRVWTYLDSSNPGHWETFYNADGPKERVVQNCTPYDWESVKCITNTIRESRGKLDGDRLNFTVKAEDLPQLCQWVDVHRVPVIYAQVLEDEIHLLPFTKALRLLAEGASDVRIKRPNRNQEKPTVFVPLDYGHRLGRDIPEPEIDATRNVTAKGRVEYYVEFDGGCAAREFDGLDSSVLPPES